MSFTINYTKTLVISFLLLTGCSTHTSTQPPATQNSSTYSSGDSVKKVSTQQNENSENPYFDVAKEWKTTADQSLIEQGSINDYDFPIVYTPEVEAYIKLFQGRLRNQFTVWLEKSGQYVPMMHAELAKAGLPLDLAYIAMIESGYDQKAYSTAQAAGLWQFMPGTGKDYNLQIGSYVDERRNALKSTKAAVKYLGDLYDIFGDWHLVVAAYNAGSGKVLNGLEQYDVDNFWDLADMPYLRSETKEYVPKLIASILIAKHPEQYGFDSIQYQEPFECDTITVGPGLSLSAVAAISNSDVKTIKSLNKELKKDTTPLNIAEYHVNIPRGTLSLAQTNLPRLRPVVTTKYKTHIVKKNESIATISKKYHINRSTLLKANNVRTKRLAKGKRLRIPYSTVTYQLLPKGSSAKLVASNNNLILHTIKKGETISKIAGKYGVTPELIVAWNELSSVHKIHQGQQLSLYIDQNSATTTDPIPDVPSHVVEHDGKKYPVLVSSKKRQPTAENHSTMWYLVRSGDSLWTISKKFNISPTQLKKINKLTSNLLRPGNKLKIANR